MNVKEVPIEALSEDPGNVRRHGEQNIKAIKASLKRFGQQMPIIVDENMVVRAGNGRLRAAEELGWQTIKVIQSDLPLSELTAFAIADNRTAELAEWDMTALADQLKALDEEGISYDTLGFEELDFPGTVSDPSYDEVSEDDPRLDEMARGVRKAIQIDFDIEDYERAQALVKKARESGAYVGGLLIDALEKGLS